MSISNTVSKVEEFEYDNASETTIDNELEKSSSTTEGKTAVREEFDASSKSLDATQLYLGEIGFSPLLTAEEEVLYARDGKSPQSGYRCAQTAVLRQSLYLA